MTRKTAVISIIAALAFFIGLLWLAKNSTLDPNAKHGPMELFGMGPELFGERARAWVTEISGIIETGIAKLGVIAAAITLFVMNVRKGRQLDEKIDDTKKEFAQRMSAQGERIHKMAMAQDPSAMPVEELKQPTVMMPAPGPTP